MVNVSVARRYARALLEAAGAQADAVLSELNGFVQALAANAELAEVVQNPAYTRAQRLAVLEAVMTAAGGLQPTLANLLRLLIERNRLGYLPDIARLYQDLTDVKAGRVRGKVVSAVPLPKDAVEKLEKSLERLTQRDVVLEPRVDPKVLGGAAAQVGSQLFDGTLRTQLDEMRRALLAR
ncbi:MAG: ATP synthase F1 subunit delta [Myxococcota bacterium]